MTSTKGGGSESHRYASAKSSKGKGKKLADNITNDPNFHGGVFADFPVEGLLARCHGCKKNGNICTLGELNNVVCLN